MLKFRDFIRTKGMKEPETEKDLIPLPINMQPGIEDFEKLGFHFYKWKYQGAGGNFNKVEVDKVMCLAKLPEGWKEGQWIGGYWYYLVDENGKNRVKVFAKNELWDRRANMQLLNE